MFCPLPLFRQLSCTAPRCTRVNCPFTHGPVKAISLPGDQLNLLGTSSPSRALHDAGTTSATASSSSSRGPDKTMIDIRGHEKAISAKRAGSPSLMETRPAKVQKVNSPIRIVQPPPSTSSGPNKSSVSISTSNVSQSSLASGPPVLNATPATSKVPLATRQALLTNLYSAFKSLYQSFHDQHPEFAYNHAIEQEKEIHGKTNKITYKNAMIACIAGLKKRPIPSTPQHPSVGTDSSLATRRLQPAPALPIEILVLGDVEPLLLSEETLRLYEYPLDIPSIGGGERPSAEEEEKECDRCRTNVIIRAGRSEECLYHWGRPLRSTTGKIYVCCSAPYPGSTGCQTGPHVFYEKDLSQLHQRHAFTPSTTENRKTQLEIAAIDCEGIYTTQGMSIARVSVVNGEGKLVFDELVKLDEGVQVIDYNTRFSGITSLDSAVLDLSALRNALDDFIGPKTVIVGHGVENDLRMLRMVHRRIVDTVVLFPNERGFPYKRALRALAKQYLDRSIQQGGPEIGHSSSEDALASLDLVKFYIKDRKMRTAVRGLIEDQ